MNQAKLVLHNFYRSSASWRVRIALHYKKLPFDYVAVNIAPRHDEQFLPAYQALNPLHEVPTLVVDGVPLAQSVAIIEYLEERWPEPTLLPVDPTQRARVRQLCQAINAGIQPLQNLRVLHKLEQDYQLDNEGKKRWIQHWNHFGLAGFEKLLEQSAGQFCVGDIITMADVFLVPQVETARRYEVDLKPYPRIVGIAARLAQHPAFVQAYASRQPDFPKEGT